MARLLRMCRGTFIAIFLMLSCSSLTCTAQTSPESADRTTVARIGASNPLTTVQPNTSRRSTTSVSFIISGRNNSGIQLSYPASDLYGSGVNLSQQHSQAENFTALNMCVEDDQAAMKILMNFLFCYVLSPLGFLYFFLQDLRVRNCSCSEDSEPDEEVQVGVSRSSAKELPIQPDMNAQFPPTSMTEQKGTHASETEELEKVFGISEYYLSAGSLIFNVGFRILFIISNCINGEYGLPSLFLIDILMAIYFGSKEMYCPGCIYNDIHVVVNKRKFKTKFPTSGEVRITAFMKFSVTMAGIATLSNTSESLIGIVCYRKKLETSDSTKEKAGYAVRFAIAVAQFCYAMVMLAAAKASAVLVTFLMWLSAWSPCTYKAMLQRLRCACSEVEEPCSRRDARCATLGFGMWRRFFEYL